MIRRRLLLLAAVAFGLSACATIPKSCRGLSASAPLMLESAQASIAQLQCAVDQNIASAQVELAKRYEAGDRVPLDLARAIALYERAATAIPPTTAIYSPPVSLGGRGQMIFLTNPNAGPGSAEAQYRLGRLLIEGLGVPKDVKRGTGLIERAAEQGYEPAIRAQANAGG